MSYTHEQRRQHIMELQRYLHALAVMNGTTPVVLPDGLYGPETSAAVREFQSSHGLNVTGTADTVTWRRIVCEYRKMMRREPMGYCPFPADGSTISQGGTGDAVYVIQTMLRSLSRRYDNFPAVEVSGEFCAGTAAAVKHFQQLSGLPVTGTVDSATWNMLVRSVR